MEPLKTPDITPMQKLVGAVGALLLSVMALLNTFELYDITGEQSAAAMGFWTALGTALVVADAVIRNGRARSFLNQPKGMAATDEAEGLEVSGEPGAVEETAPGYGGERIVHREDVASGLTREDEDPGA